MVMTMMVMIMMEIIVMMMTMMSPHDVQGRDGDHRGVGILLDEI